MTEYSRFFGGPEGAIPEYNQTHDAEVYRLMFSYGVFSDIENELAVTETDPVSLNVKVDTGWAFVHGFWYHNDSALTKSLGAADPVHARIDRIVLRLDSATNFKISCEVKAGTPAASPSPPSLTQTDAIYEISLAQVFVEAGVTSINNSKITDERNFVESKGLASVVKLTGDQTIAGVKTFGDGIKTDTVGEETSGAGVIVDDVLIKDKSIKVDTINENTSNAGTTFKKLVQTINTATDGETVTFDLAKGGLQEVTLGGNRTLALSNVSVGQCFVIDLIQDGTGSRTVTWFDTIKWTDGAAPTLTTTANKRDSFGFICKSAGNYQGYIIGQNL